MHSNLFSARACRTRGNTIGEVLLLPRTGSMKMKMAILLLAKIIIIVAEIAIMVIEIWA